MAKSGYYGHMTMADGSHVMISKEQSEQLRAAFEESKKRDEEDMPDEAAALNFMSRAFHRLKAFGWREAMYCPKDGTHFDAIEVGSTGIHDCNYWGKWPTGTWQIYADGDIWPSSPVLFRERKDTDP